MKNMAEFQLCMGLDNDNIKVFLDDFAINEKDNIDQDGNQHYDRVVLHNILQ